MDQRKRELLEYNGRAMAEREKRRSGRMRVASSQAVAIPFTMPNEGEIWLHPLSFAEDMTAYAEAGKHVKTLKSVTDPEIQAQMVQGFAQIFWVIFSARYGEDPKSDPVYDPKEDFERLAGDAAYRLKILQAAILASRLGAEDATKSGLDVFFGSILEPLEKCSSLLNNEDYWISSQEILTDLILRLRLSRQRGLLSLAASEEADPTERDEEILKERDGEAPSNFDGLEPPVSKVLDLVEAVS